MNDLLEMLKIILAVGGASAALVVVVYLLVEYDRRMKVFTAVPLTNFENPRLELERADRTARVEARAEREGLRVLRFTSLGPTEGTSVGALGTTLGDDRTLTIEFKGEVTEVNRVTLTGFPGELALVSGPQAHVDTTGDADFDTALHLESRLWSTRGSLNADTRRQLLKLLGRAGRHGKLSVRGGTLTLTLNGAEASQTASTLRGLLSTLQALSAVMRPAALGEGWLVAAARGDPNEGARARAVALLAEVPPRGPVQEAIEAALLDAASERVRLQAALALRNSSILNVIGEGALRSAVSSDRARVFAALEAAHAELALVRLLEVEDGGVQAAEALGRVGTVASVEALLERSAGGLIDSAAKRAARQAIVQIQSRIQGAEAGQISVLEGPAEAGALTVAAEGGQVSVARQTGQVSG